MELKKTITSIFMVPTLKINRDKLKENEMYSIKMLYISYSNLVILIDLESS